MVDVNLGGLSSALLPSPNPCLHTLAMSRLPAFLFFTAWSALHPDCTTLRLSACSTSSELLSGFIPALHSSFHGSTARLADAACLLTPAWLAHVGLFPFVHLHPLDCFRCTRLPLFNLPSCTYCACPLSSQLPVWRSSHIAIPAMTPGCFETLCHKVCS